MAVMRLHWAYRDQELHSVASRREGPSPKEDDFPPAVTRGFGRRAMPTLLAVDLGLRTGLALYGQDGRLLWCRSQHYGTRAALRRGVHGLLDANPEVSRLVLEGGGPIADIWVREARRRGIPVRQISAED